MRLFLRYADETWDVFEGWVNGKPADVIRGLEYSRAYSYFTVVLRTADEVLPFKDLIYEYCREGNYALVRLLVTTTQDDIEFCSINTDEVQNP